MAASQELHVLAVDDSLVDRKVIERLLKISSCKVTAVESGKRTLQYLGVDGEQSFVGFHVSSVGFHDLKVSLIMTDYSMPEMTGYELLKKIKQESSVLKEIPVVIMSSEKILQRIDRCLEEGAEEFLMKPVKLSDVKRLKDFILGDTRIRKRKVIDDHPSSSSLAEEPPSLPSSSLVCVSSSSTSLSTPPSLLCKLQDEHPPSSSLPHESLSSPQSLANGPSLSPASASASTSCPRPLLIPQPLARGSSSSSSPRSLPLSNVPSLSSACESSSSPTFSSTSVFSL